MESKVDTASLSQMPPYHPNSNLTPCATGASRTMPSTSPNINNHILPSTPPLVSPLQSPTASLEDVDLTSRTPPVTPATHNIIVEATEKNSTAVVAVQQNIAEGDYVEESDRENFEHQTKADEDIRYRKETSKSGSPLLKSYSSRLVNSYTSAKRLS